MPTGFKISANLKNHHIHHMQQVLRLKSQNKRLRDLHVQIVALVITIRMIKHVLLKSLDTNNKVQMFKIKFNPER